MAVNELFVYLGLIRCILQYLRLFNTTISNTLIFLVHVGLCTHLLKV